MIFISYAREDAAAADVVSETLSARGLAQHRDPEIPVGDAFWRRMLSAALAECRAMIAIASPSSDASPWVEQERRAFPGPTVTVTATPEGGLDGDVAALALSELAAAADLESTRSAPARATSDAPRRARNELLARYRAKLDEVRARASTSPHNRLGPDAIASDGSRLSPIDLDGRRVLVATTPVTNSQYARFLDQMGWEEPPTWSQTEFADPDQPVVGVNWFEATAYCAFVGARLPDEREWEAAAVTGAPSARYATATGALCAASAYFAAPFGLGAPRPAVAHPATPGGFFGLCGNSWDWCASAWGAHRVIKGGGYWDAPSFCEIAARYRNAPIDRDCSVGFRIAVDI